MKFIPCEVYGLSEPPLRWRLSATGQRANGQRRAVYASKIHHGAPPDVATGEVPVVMKGYACVIGQSGPAHMEVKVASVSGEMLTLEPSVAVAPAPITLSTSLSPYRVAHLGATTSPFGGEQRPCCNATHHSAALVPAEVNAKQAQNAVDLKAFRDALRAGPLWGHCPVDTDCGVDTTGFDPATPTEMPTSSASRLHHPLGLCFYLAQHVLHARVHVVIFVDWSDDVTDLEAPAWCAREA